ncbi:hypothetical protein [Lysinibacillus fusiformis]|uniref:hypothetical protein n=1 Tax=Lysinibacillus fusiformis TaxID=28031 RepID=UPI003D02C0EA
MKKGEPGSIEHPDLFQQDVIEEELVLIVDTINPPLPSIGDIQTKTLLVFRNGCVLIGKEQWLQ